MPPCKKTRSSNDKTKVSFTENWDRKKWGIFYQTHGLTPLEIWKFFDYNKMTFLVYKASFWENKIIKRQNQGLFYKKLGSNEIWNVWPESWVNPFGNMQMFWL